MEFAGYLLADTRAYHNHKETMAHACVALEIAIFGWIMSKDGWAMATSVKQALFWLAFTGIWLLLHLYIRWELRFRRWSVTQDFGIRRMLANWTSTNPTEEELLPYGEPIKNNSKAPHLRRIIADLAFPYFPGRFPPERAAIGYPIVLVEALRKADIRKDCWLYFGEWLPTGLSLLLFFIVLLRKLIDC